MKLITCLVFIIFLFLYINPVQYTNLDLLPKKINVYVNYKDKEQNLLVPIRTKVREIINLINIIDHDVDFDKLDKNKTLIDNEKIVLNIKEKKCININSASVEELIKLNGIGEKSAQLIIEFRNKRHFYVKEDLLLVKTIGPNKFNKIKDDICL